MKLDEDGVVSLSANYSAIIQMNLPLKMQNPGCFTIPCTIWNYVFGGALCNFGARHRFDAFICGEKTKIGGVNSYNNEYTNGRHMYGSTRRNPGRCIDQGGKVLILKKLNVRMLKK